jgi:hypothetical protein
LGVQAVHDELLHTLLGVIKFAVRHITPHLTHGHFIRDESQKITDDFDLLMNHPLSLSEFHQERSQEFGHWISRPVTQLLQEAMKIKPLVGLGLWWRWNR